MGAGGGAVGEHPQQELCLLARAEGGGHHQVPPRPQPRAQVHVAGPAHVSRGGDGTRVTVHVSRYTCHTAHLM